MRLCPPYKLFIRKLFIRQLKPFEGQNSSDSTIA